MKFQFDPNLDFQHEAINAVVDLFDDQEICQTNIVWQAVVVRHEIPCDAMVDPCLRREFAQRVDTRFARSWWWANVSGAKTVDGDLRTVVM